MTSNLAKINSAGLATTAWSNVSLQSLRLDLTNQAPVIIQSEARPMSPELDVWDAWPLADHKGHPVPWRGGELWFALAVPRSEDPETRHHLARIHHFHRIGNHFRHIGETLSQELTPGARQWSGSARYEGGVVTLFFTAAGRTGDTSVTFHQRIFACEARLSDETVFSPWSRPVEILEADGEVYRPADQAKGEPGKIKAFRDPSHFRDQDGTSFVLFTGSSAARPSAHDGVIGLAREYEDNRFEFLPPLIDATGVSNELERPHIVEHAGALYLFWSTKSDVFAPGIEAPTGLYGATSRCLHGPWTLLNGHGLVIANPEERPTQGYSWWVLPDLSVTSFIDYWGPDNSSVPERESRRARFGGTFAPFLQLALDGDRSTLVLEPPQ